MRQFWFHIALIFLASGAFPVVLAQEVPKTPASVTGRVWLEGQPAVNISVVLVPNMPVDPLRSKPAAQVKTDGEGYFRMFNIQPGNYRLLPNAPAYILKSDNVFGYQPGKQIILDAGENVENIELKLVRGGVITGQLTDDKGRPVIAEKIRLEKMDEDGKKQEVHFFGLPAFMYGRTDDRGVYRFYGLEAGRYMVSAGMDLKKPGVARDNNFLNDGQNTKFYPITYYPGTNNETEAQIVEVSPGSEAANINIRLGEKMTAYKITGRVIDAETGAPLEKTEALIEIKVQETPYSSSSFGISRIKENGEFVAQGLMPGKYQLRINFFQESEFIESPVQVEIKDNDLEGVIIKVRKGLTVSGRVEIDNPDSTPIPYKLSQLRLYAGSRNPAQPNDRGSSSQTTVKDDGSFVFKGLSPGELYFNVFSISGGAKGFKLARIERGGTPQTDSIKLAAGQSINDIKLVLIYGRAALRGEITVEGGELPETARVQVVAKPLTPGRLDSNFVIADERRKFLLEGLSSGEYEVTVSAFVLPNQPNSAPRRYTAKKRINIVGDSENTINITLNVSQGGQP